MASEKGGVRYDATVVGRGPVAFSGCLGQCASAHNPARNGMSQGDTGRAASSSSSF